MSTTCTTALIEAADGMRSRLEAMVSAADRIAARDNNPSVRRFLGEWLSDDCGLGEALEAAKAEAEQPKAPAQPERNPLLWRLRAMRYRALEMARALPPRHGRYDPDAAKPILAILEQAALGLWEEAPWPAVAAGQVWRGVGGEKLTILNPDDHGWVTAHSSVVDGPYSYKACVFQPNGHVMFWPEAWETEDPVHKLYIDR